MLLLPWFCLWFSIIQRVSFAFLRESNSAHLGTADEVVLCVEIIAKRFFTRSKNVLIISAGDSFTTGELLRRIEPNFGINLADEENRIDFSDISNYIIFKDDISKDPYEMVENMNLNPRGMFVIITRDDTEALKTAASRFWSSGIPNVIFLQPLNDETVTIFGYDVSLRYPNFIRLYILDKWESEFLYRSNLFPNKFKNMEQYPLKLTVLNTRQMQPDIYIIRDDAELKIEGVGSNLINAFAEKLNFKVLVYENSYYGHKEKDGTWNGPPAQLIRGDADLTFTGILPTVRATQALDYSNLYRWDALHFVTRSAGKTVSWKSVFKPLSSTVWILQIIVLLIILCLVRIVKRFWSMNIIKEYIKSIDVLRVVFLQSVVYPKYTGIRLAFALWLIYSYLIATSFTCSLVNFLSMPSFEKIPNNFDELQKSNLQIGGPLSVRTILGDSGDPVARKIHDRFVNLTYPDFWPILAAKERAVVLYSSSAIIHNWKYRANGSMHVHMIEDAIIGLPFMYYMRKGHPYREPLNDFIKQIHSSGLVIKWMSDYKAVKIEKIHKELSVVLTLEHLAGIFLILICGHIVSGVTFFYELYQG